MKKFLFLFIILVPFIVFSSECDGDWRKQVTEANFDEYLNCMTEAEQNERKLFTTDANELSSIGYATTNYSEKCLQKDKFFGSLNGKNLAKALETKFNKNKAKYNNETKSYKMIVMDKDAQLVFISFFEKKNISNVLKQLQSDPFFKPTVISEMPKENIQVLYTHPLDSDYFEQVMCYTPNGSKELYIENKGTLSILREEKEGTYLYLSYIDSEAYFAEGY